ncbi:flagellar hook assembly protein FlgD [Telmatospirillum sp. J64-1]|uniref:flagellar hook assembly protein FlgD n=1 Tax=Telmatospirillum sp. J64-1 TaxID=2502183 RepID=UPI00115CC19E|nr:flagellar hook capping FlgD N-terminal domain-containing protein [Telmatospirillum sp. J64-1]
MTVSSVNSASNVANSASEGARTKLAENLDTFLLMLTTQLKNQDPLSPMDTHQFTAQLVQFASVEQQISTNQQLEQLVKLNQGNQVTSALGYIGQTVEVDMNALPLQNGTAKLRYLTPADSKEVTFTITNEAGSVVATLKGQTTAGEHELTWDGKDQNGQQAPDGTYKVTATATDKDGVSVVIPTRITGLVTGVAAEEGDITLELGDFYVPLDQIRSVRFQPKS